MPRSIRLLMGWASFLLVTAYAILFLFSKHEAESAYNTYIEAVVEVIESYEQYYRAEARAEAQYRANKYHHGSGACYLVTDEMVVAGERLLQSLREGLVAIEFALQMEYAFGWPNRGRLHVYIFKRFVLVDEMSQVSRMNSEHRVQQLFRQCASRPELRQIKKGVLV